MLVTFERNTFSKAYILAMHLRQSGLGKATILFTLKTSGLLAVTVVGLHHSCFAVSGTIVQSPASSCQKAVQELSSGLKTATRLLAGLSPLTAQPHTHARSAAALT